MRHYFNLHGAQCPIKVHLVGCGGTGSHLATRLVQLNTTLLALGHPGIEVSMYDPDLVSEANVGRQLFYNQDIGLPKVTVLVTRINQCTGFRWEGVPVAYPAPHSRTPDIVITAVDSAKARIKIGKALKKNRKQIYWLDCGNMKRSGQVVFGLCGLVKQPKGQQKKAVNRLPTVLDLYPELAKSRTGDDQGPSCSLAEAIQQQDLYINAFMALEASEMLWKAFRYGYLEYSVAYINLEPRNTGILPIDPKVWRRFGYQYGRRCKKS